MPHDHAVEGRDALRSYAELEEAQRTLDQGEKEQLARHHQDEREAFSDSRHEAFREARQAAYQEVRQEYKPRWVEHFRDANRLRHEAEQGAAILAVKVLHHAAAGDFEIAWDLLSDREALGRNAENWRRTSLRADSNRASGACLWWRPGNGRLSWSGCCISKTRCSRGCSTGRA